MNRFLHSIPTKVSIIILVVETVLLTIMGTYYINIFCGEIDRNVKKEMLLPATLMSQRALNFDTVMDFQSLGRIVNEEVIDAFICKQDGSIFYSNAPDKVGKPYQTFLEPNESRQLTAGDQEGELTHFTGEDGSSYVSSFSPLRFHDNLIGYLYIRINADRITASKKAIMALFVIGSLITIALTTLIEALFVRRLLSPRIKDICAILTRVGRGELKARVTSISSQDEIDSIGTHLNKMIDTVEQTTLNLQHLNQAGELFATAENREEIFAITSDTITTQLDLTQGSSGFRNNSKTPKQPSLPCMNGIEDQDRRRIDSGEIVVITPGITSERFINELPRATMFFPMQENEHEQSVLCFYARDEQLSLNPIEVKYLSTLQHLATNALRRLTLRKKSWEAENKHRELFDSALEGIFRCSTDGHLDVANPALAEMTGYKTADRMLDEFNRQRATLLGDTEEQERLCERINALNEVRDEEIRAIQKDGSRFWASLTAHARRDPNGEMIAMEGAIVNIEERKFLEKSERERQVAEAANLVKSKMLATLKNNNQKLEETLAELRIAQSSLMQSERMATIGMTASGVAHDLNNILSGVINYPELLLAKLPEDSELRKPLKSIVASGLRAAAVVDDMLTLTRGTAQNKKPVDLNKLINDYLASSEYENLRQDHREIKVKAKLFHGLRPILCAQVYIYKMIMNLITNSIEAMGDRGEVQIITENTTRKPEPDMESFAPGDDYVTLKIVDNGPGIAKTDIDHIFEPFYSKKVMGLSGTGLGLTIVQNAVIEHNGLISVDTGDQGTTFTIDLPAHDTKEIIVNETEEDMDLQGSGTVLVVDDEALQRDIAESILKDSGYTVHLAGSGEEAIAFCREHVADLILLDMLMPPGMNGRQTFEAIRCFRPQQKALIVSGFSEDNEVKEAIKAGCLGFLKKPYTMAQLINATQSVLSK